MVSRIAGRSSCRRRYRLTSHHHFLAFLAFLLDPDVQFGTVPQRRPIPTDHRVRTGRRSSCLRFTLLLLQHPFPFHLPSFHFPAFLFFSFPFPFSLSLLSFSFPFLLFLSQFFFPLAFPLLVPFLSLSPLTFPLALFSLPLTLAFLRLSTSRLGRYRWILLDGRWPWTGCSRRWLRRVRSYAARYCTSPRVV